MKKIKNLGKTLNKAQQKLINGGGTDSNGGGSSGVLTRCIARACVQNSRVFDGTLVRDGVQFEGCCMLTSTF